MEKRKQATSVVNKKYKIWAIAATSLAAILVIATVILVVVLATQTDDAETSVNKNTTEYQKTEASDLDESKLITSANLTTNEIPDHYVGKKNAKIIVIEYEDFACSHCQALAHYAEQIHADYQNRVLFIHRSFNLGFANSAKTLRAAEAAYYLGGEEAYWAMAKLLYQDTRWLGQEVLGSQSVLNDYAEQIGLDADKFKNAMSEAAVTDKVTRDKKLGVTAGVKGTPTWLINGQQITPRDDDIRAALDIALQNED
ncbi:DsbA family protein [Candidatus Saccharibacteria bacterium]|nr:DsbA family protein [Candidatus Saccharibacteria bacterium]